MREETEATEQCSGCRLVVPGGMPSCQAIFDELLARDFSNPVYFRVHRMMVDIYTLQHPERYSKSAKSFAAHLTGLCWFIDNGGSRAVGKEFLRKWLDGSSPVEKPDIPLSRGKLTIQDVTNASDPEAYAQAVERWGHSTWEAYAPLHALARAWIQQALAGRKL